MRIGYTLIVSLLAFTGLTQTHAAGDLTAKSNTAKPIIKSVSGKKCLNPGDALRLSGNNFMPSAQRGVVIITPNGRVNLAITTWTVNRITTQLPRSGYLQPGKRYPVVIINTRDNRVLSNRDKSIQRCEEIKKPEPKNQKPKPKKPKTKSPETGKAAQPQIKQDTALDRERTPDRSNSSTAGSLIGAGLPQASYVSQLKQSEDNTYELGELIVISQDMPTAKKLAALAVEQGYRIKRRRSLKNLGLVISVVAIPKETKLADALKQLQQRDKSLLIDANHRYQFSGPVEDKKKGSNEHRQTHKSIGWGKVHANCGSGIKLGVIDSLVDTGHPSFHREHIINKSLLPFGIKPADKQHATAIASILVGQPGSPVTGLLPAAKLYVAGIFRRTPDNRVDTTAELIVSGLDWLYGQGVHAINLSIAGPRNLLLEVSIKRLLKQQVLIAAAVGNRGLENVPMYPAAIDGVIGVTAVDARHRVYKKANRGKFVRLAAPGVDIWSAREDGKQAYVSGTSFATPYVTATLATLKKRNRKSLGTEIRKKVYHHTVDLGEKGKDNVFGWGQLQFTGCS